MSEVKGLALISAFMASAVYFNYFSPIEMPRYKEEQQETVIVAEDRIIRGLTEGEQQLAHSIFGDTIDTSAIKIEYLEQIGEDSAPRLSKTMGSKIKLKDQSFYSDDYTRTFDIKRYADFVYNLTHIWQNQNQIVFTNQDGFEDDYSLNYFSHFDSFGPNQQASIVSDYATRFFSRFHKTKNEYSRDYSADFLLKNVVEGSFPEAKDTREASDSQTQRGMTDHERALAKLIFGDEIGITGLRMHLRNQRLSDKAASVTSSNDIYFWGDRHWPGSFHKSEHSEFYYYDKGDQKTFREVKEHRHKIGVFVHEITHIWQRQNYYSGTAWFGRLDNFDRLFNKHGRGEYSYSIENADQEFSDFKIEQQAEIIRNYVLTYLYDNATPSSGRDIAHIVEKRFPHLTEIRQYVQEHGRLPFEESNLPDNHTEHKPKV